MYAPEAAEDLELLYEHIAERSGEVRALGYVDRIKAACDGLQTFRSAAENAMICGLVCGSWDLSVVSRSLSMSLLPR